MRKDRTPKNSQQSKAEETEKTSPAREFPVAILEAASKEFSFEISCIQITTSGAIFLAGWTDDRSSRLDQVRIQGRAWSKVIDSRHIGRHRHADTDLGSTAPQQRLFGFWSLALHDRTLIDGDLCFVELVLTNGASRSREVGIEFIAAEDFRARFAKFWNDLSDTDRLPPIELTYLEQALKRQISSAEVIMPKHTIEVITTSAEGGIFVNGWIDDTSDKLEFLRVSGSDGQITFQGNSLARTYREDVQTALAISRMHEFGFWGFAANDIIQRRGNKVEVDIVMSSGARQRQEISFRSVDQIELRNIVLTYLASSQHLGNPHLEAVAGLEKYIGGQIIDLNLKLSRKIVSHPYVERFGYRSNAPKASIVVCLYGKPEYLFLQNSLFSNRPGIENYEFIYICNSPELAEPLLRDARIAASAYDIDQTVVILPDNAGFGAANNAAVNFAQTDRVLVVNPDVFPFDQDWAVKHSNIVEQLPGEQTKIFGVPLYYDDGTLMHGGMYFEAERGLSIEQSAFKSRNFLRVEHYGKGSPPRATKFVRSRPVPAVTGAFISLNRNWFETIGGFSEDYVFGHYEDADLCLKSLEKGVAPWIHDIKLWHLEGKGSHRLPVHEGASIVNRWLFNKRWAEKIIPDLLGPSPTLASLRNGPREDTIAIIPSPPRDLALTDGIRGKRRMTRPTARETGQAPGDQSRLGSGDIEILFSER